eukprot:4066698-Prymnesium_polylepis.1
MSDFVRTTHATSPRAALKARNTHTHTCEPYQVATKCEVETCPQRMLEIERQASSIFGTSKQAARDTHRAS